MTISELIMVLTKKLSETGDFEIQVRKSYDCYSPLYQEDMVNDELYGVELLIIDVR